MRLRLTLVALVFGGLVALYAYAGGTGNKELGEVGIDLLFVPVVVTAYFFGLRGAVPAAGVATAIGVVLYALGELFTATVLAVSLASLVVVGAIVGRSVDAERRKSRTLERRHELSLELLATMREGRFAVVNPVWEQKLGYLARDLIGRPFVELVHPDDVGQVDDARAVLARGGEITARPTRMRHVDGSYLWIEWSARHDPADDCNHIAGRDITAKREAEEMLALHKEMLEQAVVERTAELQARTSELERTSRQLDLARREDLRRLAMVAEFRDDRTSQHTERVGIVSALVARELGLPESDIQTIREAAPLHDIGKIGVPDAILLNPRALSAAEWAVMRQHTTLGQTILGDSEAPVLTVGAVIALSHHEWWDGSGYPQGLAGAQIPLSARIVALADVFDALTHDRPYKPAWTLDSALHEIAALAGRQFDPEIVSAFLRLRREHLEALLTQPAHERGADEALAG